MERNGFGNKWDEGVTYTTNENLYILLEATYELTNIIGWIAESLTWHCAHSWEVLLALNEINTIVREFYN